MASGCFKSPQQHSVLLAALTGKNISYGLSQSDKGKQALLNSQPMATSMDGLRSIRLLNFLGEIRTNCCNLKLLAMSPPRPPQALVRAP
eukprot:8165700-Heterocapsa_arctica.AAC.1